MPVLQCKPAVLLKGEGQIGPFFIFLGAISDCNAGFPQWRSLAHCGVLWHWNLYVAEVRKGDLSL